MIQPQRSRAQFLNDVGDVRTQYQGLARSLKIGIDVDSLPRTRAAFSCRLISAERLVDIKDMHVTNLWATPADLASR
jgi:hypothetical protein